MKRQRARKRGVFKEIDPDYPDSLRNGLFYSNISILGLLCPKIVGIRFFFFFSEILMALMITNMFSSGLLKEKETDALLEDH